MEYEGTRKSFYESRVHELAEQIASILDSGRQVEISQSRSGVKLSSFRRKRESIQRKQRKE